MEIPLYQEMLDFQFENEELYTLYSLYSRTEIYNALADFLDEYRPDWRLGKGLGSRGAEFILNELERLAEDETIQLDLFYKDIFQVRVMNHHIEILDNYDSVCNRFQLRRVYSDYNEFENYWQENYDSIDSNLNYEIYESQSEKFTLRKDEKIHIGF